MVVSFTLDMVDQPRKELLKRVARIAVPLLIILVLVRLLSPSLKSDISFSQAVYDRNGKLLRLMLSRDEKYRLWLPLKSISPVLAKATLLHEDKRFRFHPGVRQTWSRLILRKIVLILIAF